MYKITADGALIYDSTLEDYKIGKGQITLEADKSGSFVFSLYPDHPYYDALVKLKTVITVYKDGVIVFRGRVLNDVTDHWNNRVYTCEGELGFLQDSIVRPYTFSGNPADLFRQLIEAHNAQADEFKRFKVGVVTVTDPNGYIARENSAYETTLTNLTGRLTGSETGGHLYITHDIDDDLPTIHYLADFPETSTQAIEFGVNLRTYTKTVKAEDLATAIIPLGATIDDGDSETTDARLTIADVNDGVDYVYSPEGVAMYGWIFKVVEWDDVTEASNLKTKAEADLAARMTQAVTIELTALDMHLLDRSIDSYKVCQYIPASSTPHGFAATMLCNKQTLDLLRPSNDSVILGHSYATFTERSTKQGDMAKTIRAAVHSAVGKLSGTISGLSGTTSQNSAAIVEIISRLDALENGGELPSGYTLLEYIEGTGTQYIDTGFTPGWNTRVVMDAYLDISANKARQLYGSRYASNSGYYYPAIDSSGTWRYAYGTGVYSLSSNPSGRVTVETNVDQFTVNGVSTTANLTTFTCSASMYLLAVNGGGTYVSTPMAARIYSCQIYDNMDTLVRDFVPCKNADGVLGLYDKVNAEFYSNAGTGTFTGA